MTRRLSVRLVLPLLVAGLALSACGGDEDEPSSDVDSDSSASVAPETSDSEIPDSESSDSETSEPADTETSAGDELDEAAAASCAELDTIATDIGDQFEDGVGIEAGAVLDEQQVEAVTSLVDGFAAVDASDEELAGLVDELLATAGTVLDRAETGDALTDDDAAGFEDAFGEVANFCTSG